MNDEEEGFTCDSATELVELNYLPTYHTRPQQHPLPNNLRLPQQHNPLTHILSQELTSSLAQRFLQQHKNDLVFNSNNRTNLKHQNELVFQSNFQSGNLQYATQSGKQYHLYMRSDTNTQQHHQWFYFRVKNKQKKRYTFIIKNFAKSSMLYNRGLKPYTKSLRKAQLQFQQLESNVRFQEEINQEENVKYSLKFQYHFQHNNDEVQFCTQPPYTHNRLESILNPIPLRKIEMATTAMGNKIKALITNPYNAKALVIVIARQHPGETVGSWMMEGFLNKLKSKLDQTNIAWLIIPMINIDGVMLGNNRTGLLGYDFNRHWNCDEDSLKQPLFPEISGILKYFKKYKREKGKRIKMFLDLHGHSSEPNIFAYGPPHSKQSEYYESSRLFPYLMNKRNDNFKLNQCSYEINPDKKYCSRSVFFSKLGFPYSYTIESSFGIYNNKNINETDVVQVGEDLFQTTVEFINAISNEKQPEFLGRLLKETMQHYQQNNQQFHNYESDSEEEESLEQIPLAFQQKMNSYLKSRNKIKLENIQRRISHHNQDRPAWNYSDLKYTNSNNHTQSNLKQRKIKTEPLAEQPTLSARKPKIHFPFLNRPKIASQNFLPKKSVFNRSVKKMKMQNIQCRFYKDQKCQIGKGIFILNGYIPK